ncbi:MAG: YfiR family protein [Acidobacteria bacterium]|nr:YfiR family protein [Acidobacteriota bacterium]
MRGAILIRRCAGRLAQVAALCAIGTAVIAQAATSEDSLKAAFLYNFAKYVDWPADAFPSGTLRICLFADTQFTHNVDEIIEGESLAGRPVVRLSAPPVADLSRLCNVVFVSATEGSRIEATLASVRGARVLTVGEGSDFIRAGGMFAFIKEYDRIRFDANVAEAERAGLTISSRLLRLARHVVTRSGGGRHGGGWRP